MLLEAAHGTTDRNSDSDESSSRTPGNRKREKQYTNDLEELVKDLRFQLAEGKGRRAELEEIHFKMFNEKLQGPSLE
jgi:hypothetical protein